LASGFWPSVLVFCGTAHASGYSIASFGGEQGTPMTTNATALYYNPSGIADSEGGHLYVDANTAWRHAGYDRPASPSDAPVPPGAEGANTGHASLLNLIPSPFAGATYKLGRVGIGAAFFTPFGGQSAWDKNDRFEGNTSYPGPVDGVARWSAISGILRSSYFSLGAAYDFGPVSVGVVGNLIQTVVELSQARQPTADNDITTEGRSLLDVRGWNGSVGFGVTYKAIPNKLRLGLSYQSRPGFGGGMVVSGTLKTVFSSGQLDTNAVDFTTDLPEVLRAGAAYRPRKDLELRLFGDFQTWSVLVRQCVVRSGSSCEINPDGSARPGSNVIVNQPREFHDTFGIRGSASYWTSEHVELIFGAGFASNAIPARTYEPAILDGDAVTLSGGAVLGVLPQLSLGLGYMQLLYLPRDTIGQSVTPELVSPSSGPDPGGKYSLQAGVFTVSADFAF
jgi:long-chain fatty acid transport protein